MALRVQLHHDRLRSTRPRRCSGTWSWSCGAGSKQPARNHPDNRACRRSPFHRPASAASRRRRPLDALETEHLPRHDRRPRFEHLAAAVSARHGPSTPWLEHRGGGALPGSAGCWWPWAPIVVAGQARLPELLEALKHEAPFWKQGVDRQQAAAWIEGTRPLSHSSEQGQAQRAGPRAPCPASRRLVSAGSPASRSAPCSDTDAGGGPWLPSTDA